MSTDYGYGLKVDWTPKELRKIEEYRVNAAVRRLFGLDNNGVRLSAQSDRIKQAMKEVWNDLRRN